MVVVAHERHGMFSSSEVLLDVEEMQFDACWQLGGAILRFGDYLLGRSTIFYLNLAVHRCTEGKKSDKLMFCGFRKVRCVNCATSVDE